MSKVRDISRSEFRCYLQQVLVPQNVKRRAICLFCFCFAPLPKRAKYRGGASTEYARSANTPDRKSTRLNSSHTVISYAVFCLKKKKKKKQTKQYNIY